MNRFAIVLAAGKGTRMRSAHPKVVHRILGKAMIARVLEAIQDANIDKQLVVIGHGSEEVSACLSENARTVIQTEQLGTGHAVLTALSALDDETLAEETNVLVTCGDTPLIRAESLRDMISIHESEGCTVTVMTTHLTHPTGYGRIIRNGNAIACIVEEKDADNDQKKITEINVGTYCFNLGFLRDEIAHLTTDNAQGEFYLTDLLSRAYKNGKKTAAYILKDPGESLGVNNRVQLAEAISILRRRRNEYWMMNGVTMEDPDSVIIEDDVTLGRDIYIERDVRLMGKTVIEDNVVLESGTRITDSIIKNGAAIKQSVVKESIIGAESTVGPFAQLRPGSILEEHVKVGDFVEIKNSHVESETKISHHTYIGDADIGKRVNIGCGTITCNFDGTNKFRTVIGDDAFIGSNTCLIAPITIGAKTLIGAGSTLSKDVEDHALALNRAKLIVKENWRK